MTTDPGPIKQSGSAQQDSAFLELDSARTALRARQSLPGGLGACDLETGIERRYQQKRVGGKARCRIEGIEHRL